MNWKEFGRKMSWRNQGTIRHLSTRAEEKHKKHQSKKLVSRLRFEPRTSWVQFYSLNFTPPSLVSGLRYRTERWKELTSLWRAVHSAKLLATSFIWTFTTKFKITCHVLTSILIQNVCFKLNQPFSHARIGFSTVKSMLCDVNYPATAQGSVYTRNGTC
jgi:hypothetical protein